jgi:hypothetical protein
VAFLLFPILEISNPLSGFFYPSKRIEVGDLGEGKNLGNLYQESPATDLGFEKYIFSTSFSAIPRVYNTVYFTYNNLPSPYYNRGVNYLKR